MARPGRESAPRAHYSGADLPPVVRRLGAASFCQDVASEMVYPLLPGFLTALGGGAALLGAMESAAEGVVALVKGWAGRASDRAGRRRPFVAVGYGLSALLRPLLAIAIAPWQVVALRIGDRFAKGVRTAPRDALLAGAVEPERRAYAFSFHRGLDHLGAAVGPLLAAGVLAMLGPDSVRWVFALATLPALAGVATIFWGVRDADARVLPAAALPARVAAPPGFRRVLAAGFLFALGNASDAFLLLRAAELGASTLGLTLLWSGFHVVKWAASVPGGRLADRIGRRRALGAGWLLYALVYTGFAAGGSTPVLLALLAAYGVHFGLVEGAERALALELGGALGAGAALGAWHRTVGFGALGASLLFGAVWQTVSAPAAFLLGATLAAAAAALLATGRGQR